MKLSGVKISSTIFCLCLFLASAAFADDYHYVNTLVGNRSPGLGGAYTAVSDGPAGCYYNPAGIAFAPRTSLSASANALATSKKTYKGPLLLEDGNRVDWEQDSFDLLPNFFGIVLKFGSGTVGFSYAVPDSIQRRQRQIFHDILSGSGKIDTYTININDSDKTYLFGPSYAYAFSDSFSVGATLYGYYRDREIIRNHLLQYENGQQYLSNCYETKIEWAYKPILGTIWEPLDKLALGLSLSKTYAASSDYEKQTITNSTSAITLETLSSSEKDKFPLTISLGAAYFASPRLLLSGDIRYYEEISDRPAVYNLSLGTEYYFTDTLALRAGFFTDMANTPELSSTSVNQPEHVDIYGISLSFSLFRRMSSITLGILYGFGKGQSQIIQNSSTMYDVEIQNLALYLSASY